MSTANDIAGIARRRSPSFFWAFQDVMRKLHFWLGVTALLYVAFVCLSGLLLLFENDLYRLFSPDPPFSATGGPRLSANDLARTAFQRYPDHRVVGVWDRRVSDGLIAELWLDGQDGMRRRLFHPYTGADLGDAQPGALKVLALFRDAHENLLAGRTGRMINGAGSICLLLLALSGTLTWFVGRYRSRLRPLANPARAIHLRAGIWVSAFAGIWGLTGALFAFPFFTHLLGPMGAERLLEWSYALHSGSAGGWSTRIVWAAFSLLTALLAITGMAMWRKRVSGNNVRTGSSTQTLRGRTTQSS
jgi:uncharacterized iron-regulated membrane protein